MKQYSSKETQAILRHDCRTGMKDVMSNGCVVSATPLPPSRIITFSQGSRRDGWLSSRRDYFGYVCPLDLVSG